MTLSNGTPRTPRADVRMKALILTHRLQRTTLSEMLVLISLTENVAQTATLAPFRGLPMTPTSGTQLKLLADVSLVAPITRVVMVAMMVDPTMAPLLTLTIPPIDIPGVTRASPIQTMTVLM